jgi:zinc protease
LPFLAVAFRGPAFSETDKDKVALNLLAEIAFGENSELYKRLVLTEQKVDALSPSFGDRKDPELFTVIARVKKPTDLEDVRSQVLKTFERYTKETIPIDKLNATRSRIRYSFALRMNSSGAIASALAPYISLSRTPESINKVFSLVETVTPEDVRNAAARYFTENNRTIVTLSAGGSRQGGEGR